MKHTRLLLSTLVLAIVLVAAFALAACGETGTTTPAGDYKDTYYAYHNGVKDSSDWVKLDKSSWSDSDGNSGRIETKSGVLYLYVSLFGEEDVFAYGTVKDGVFAYTYGIKSYDGKLVYYNMYKDGSGASNKDSSEYTVDVPQGGQDQPDPTPTAKTYTVTFDSKGGSAVSSVSVKEGQRLTAPQQPTRQMYMFGGWYKDSALRNAWDFDLDTVDHDVTLYAKWQADEVRVSTVDGATIEGNNIFVAVEQGVDDLDLSERVVLNSDTATWKLYYDKLGRDEIRTKIATNDDGSLDSGSNLFYIVVTSADGTQSKTFVLDVYKKYPVAIGVYDVYDVLVDTYYLSTLDVFQAPQRLLDITGYDVTGWRGAGLSLGATIPKDCVGLAVYPVATAKQYTLTYDPAGGELDPLTRTVTYDGNFALPTPTREGYTFDYWTHNGNNVSLSDGTHTWRIDGDATFAAHWTINRYLVEASRNDNSAGKVTISGVDSEGYANYASTVTLSATTNSGYNWLGWYQGDELYSEETAINYIVPASDSRLTARYNYYTVTTTYEGCGAPYDGVYKRKVSVGDTVTIQLGALESSSMGDWRYFWAGWYEGDTKVSDGTDWSYTFVMTAQDRTFTAKSYKLELLPSDNNAGTVKLNTSQSYVGGEVTITATTNNGYTWVGWFDGDTKISDGTELSYTFNMPNENKTYTARWIRCPITLSLNDPSAGSVTGVDRTALGAETTITASTNIGYTWLGWFDGDTKVCDDLSYTFVLTEENKTYTAKWEVWAEMAIFDFTSTDTTCTITGIKDKTCTDIVVPDYVTKIVGGAFSGCSSLESITIPFIGDEAGKTEADYWLYPFGYIFGTSSYTGCVSTKQKYYLTSSQVGDSTVYYIPATLRTVKVRGGRILKSAFLNCTELTTISLEVGVKSIGEYAFSGCSGLTSITIPDSVSSIGKCAFSSCRGLTSVTIGSGVTSIGDAAFSGCSGLTSVTIPDSVTIIRQQTFYYCSGLTSVTIPDSVTWIQNDAFSGCSKLTSIDYHGTKTQWNAISKGSSWNYSTGKYTVHCTDGDIAKS